MRLGGYSSMNVFDIYVTLMARAFQRLTPSRLRLARGVACAIGIALCSASPAGQATTSQQITPFRYATFQIGELQAACLFRIAIRESNINYKAINKTSGALGAWQIVNPLVAKLDALDQVDWAIRYAEHKYGSACAAWSFWQKEYWW